MKNAIIDKIEKALQKNKTADFGIGSHVKVHVKIIEGNKERIQVFEGVVIAIDGGGSNTTFTVRKVISGHGIEKKFLLHSPRITSIDVLRHSKTRRAKLFYLRDRIGNKAQRLKEETIISAAIIESQEEVKQHLKEEEEAERIEKEKRHEERLKNKEQKSAGADSAADTNQEEKK